MIWLDARTYELAELVLPDDWQDRLSAAHNKELAASIKATSGPIHLPVIENATGEIVAGVDRIAAQVVGGQKRFECRGWVGAPEEKRMVRAAENAHRRQDSARWATEYLEAKRALKAANASQREAQYSAAATKNCAGQPKTADTVLREEAASDLQMKPEALRGRLRREAEMDADPTEPVVEPAPKPLTLKQRVRNVVRELEELMPVTKAFADETEERSRRADEARDIYRDNPNAPSIVTLHHLLLSVHDLLTQSHGYAEGAVTEMERIESALRRVDAPSRPKTGLGGRKL